MSTKFEITKTGTGAWYLRYPDGFDNPIAGIGCHTFAHALAQFAAAAERQCPECGKGRVIDTPTGWECQACGLYDTAVCDCGTCTAIPQRVQATT